VLLRIPKQTQNTHFAEIGRP